MAVYFPLRVLLIGASSGIGQHLLTAALKDGAIVGATTHTSPVLAFSSESLLTLKCDVRNPGDIKRAVADFVQFASAIDIAIYMPGIMTPKLHTYVQQEDIEEQVNVNLKGAMLMTREVLPGMIRKMCGKIVFASSVSVGQVTSGTCIYSSTKAALENFSLCLNREYAKCNLQAVAFRLPPTATTMLDKIRPQDLSRLSPDGSPVRISSPEIVANKIWNAVIGDLALIKSGIVDIVDDEVSK